MYRITGRVSKRNYTNLYTFSVPPRKITCVILNACGRVTGTAVLPVAKCLSFKTEVYLLLSIDVQWELSLVRSLGQTVHKDGEKTLCTPCRPNTILPFHSGSLWRVSLFGSLYFTVCKNWYIHSLIIPQYLVGSSALKKAKRDGSLFKFFVEQFGNPFSTTSK